MYDQYDPLLGQHLSVFLSGVSESRLLLVYLEEEKLHSMTGVDVEGHSKLHLVALLQIPPALFDLSQLLVLKLELIKDARFTVQVANINSLKYI